jgi:hypothetical protein
MTFRKGFKIGLFLLSILLPLVLVMAAAVTVQPVEAARRPTRTPRPTKTPIPTVTPIPSPIPTAGGGGTGVAGAWELVDSPNVSNRNNRLNGLAVVTANDIWAVGQHSTSNNSNVQTLAMHWNGSTWEITASPNPDPGRNLLNGVVAISIDDVWAVGVAGGNTGPNWYSLTLHWDGNAWTNVAAPVVSPGTSELRGVSALSSSDVWAVGAYSSPDTGWWNRPLILHFDGNSWTSVPAPAFGSQSELNAVTALAPNDVWAVGRASENNWKTLILHWDGASWSRIPSPNLGPYGNTLSGVTAASTNDVWAVGTANNGNSTLTLHWDGSAWSLVSSPNGTARQGINRNALQSVTAISEDDVWAVGTQASSSVGGAGQPIYFGYALILHWDGSAWSEVPAAALPGTGEDGSLTGVAAISSDDVWSAGYFYEPNLSVQAYRTLIQLYTIP